MDLLFLVFVFKSNLLMPWRNFGVFFLLLLHLCTVHSLYEFDFETDDYLNGGKVQFEYNSAEKNWTAANLFCQSTGGYGAFLASLHSKEESIHIAEKIPTKFTKAGRKVR